MNLDVLSTAYILFILAIIVVLVLNFTSSFLLAIGKFEKYWSTKYPIIMALSYVGYGVLKTSFQLNGIIALVSGFLFGLFFIISINIKIMVVLRFNE